MPTVALFTFQVVHLVQIIVSYSYIICRLFIAYRPGFVLTILFTLCMSFPSVQQGSWQIIL